MQRKPLVGKYEGLYQHYNNECIAANKLGGVTCGQITQVLQTLGAGKDTSLNKELSKQQIELQGAMNKTIKASLALRDAALDLNINQTQREPLTSASIVGKALISNPILTINSMCNLLADKWRYQKSVLDSIEECKQQLQLLKPQLDVAQQSVTAAIQSPAYQAAQVAKHLQEEQQTQMGELKKVIQAFQAEELEEKQFNELDAPVVHLDSLAEPSELNSSELDQLDKLDDYFSDNYFNFNPSTSINDAAPLQLDISAGQEVKLDDVNIEISESSSPRLH